MVTSHERGWKIYLEMDIWRYSDTKMPCNGKRPCRRCGKPPTEDGHDACIGTIDGAKSACCGHGVSNPILVKNGSA
jgi:hypothetical protein